MRGWPPAGRAARYQTPAFSTSPSGSSASVSDIPPVLRLHPQAIGGGARQLGNERRVVLVAEPARLVDMDQLLRLRCRLAQVAGQRRQNLALGVDQQRAEAERTGGARCADQQRLGLAGGQRYAAAVAGRQREAAARARSARTGTPASSSASMSRCTVRVETPSRAARSAAVNRRPSWRSSSSEISRRARMHPI